MPSTTVDADPASRVDNALERRGVAYSARHWLWDRHDQLPESRQLKVRTCGRVSRTADGVTVRVTTAGDGTRTAGLSGVATCGSVWACPVCSRKIAKGRQEELCKALSEAHRRGWRVGMVTLTMRHRRGHRLARLFKAVSAAWNAATSGRGWVADQETFGMDYTREVRSGLLAGIQVTTKRIPFVRVLEVTHGERNGWHVHVHALVFLPAGSFEQRSIDIRQIGARMWQRWSDRLEALGFQAPDFDHGLDAKIIQGDPSAALSDYFTKAVFSASLEVARGDLKDAKSGNRTPFGVLRGLVETWRTGELGTWATADDEDVWAEWESASKGRRQMTWSPGLRADLVPDLEERSDEELAEDEGAELGGDEEATIPSAVWSSVTRARADWKVLAAFTESTPAGWAVLEPFYTAHDRDGT